MHTEHGDVRHNEAKHRFEVDLGDGQLALLQYRQQGDAIYYTHTEVPPDHEGEGIAGQMAKAALTEAREKGYRVYPLCPFVAAYIRRHKEYQDLL